MSATTSRAMARHVTVRSLALACVVLTNSVALAQDPSQSNDGVLPWDKVQQLVQHFDQVSPPPPPLETMLLGTYDASTGVFIWGPAIELWEVPVDLPYNDQREIAPAFDMRGIPPIAVDLDPQIVGLSSVGLSNSAMSNVGSPAVDAHAASGAAAHAKPGHASGSGARSVNDTSLPTAAIGQRFRGHPLERGVMRTFVRAAKIAFVVEVVNRPADQVVLLTIDGSTAQAAADQIDVIAKPRTYHVFDVTCGGKRFNDKLFVERPPLIGVFQLEALPITIVYEPPGGAGCTQTYESIHRAGTQLRAFKTTESSSNEPVETPFTSIQEFAEIAKAVGGVASKVPFPPVKIGGEIVAGIGENLGSVLGTIDVHQQVTNTVTESHTLAFELTEGVGTQTTEALGPGKGDVVHFLTKPTFAWLVAEDPPSGNVFIVTTLLGFEGTANYSARSLREHTMAVPPAAMQDLLLALDPLAPEYTGTPAGLSNEGFGTAGFGSRRPVRLVPLASPMQYVSGAHPWFFCTHTMSASDENLMLDVTATTTKSTAGFLSFLSSSLPHDEDSQITVTEGCSEMRSTSDTVDVRVDLLVQSGIDGLALEVSFDRLFGTFAFKEVQLQAQMLSGTVGDESGGMLGDAGVTMSFADGRSMQTRTDKEGRFAMRPPVGVNGAIVLKSGGARTTVDWNGTARSGIQLRGAVAKAASGPDSRAKSGGGKTKTTGSRFPDPKTVPVTATEGTTAGAIRGKPGSADKRLAELEKENAELKRTVADLQTKLDAAEPAQKDGGAAKSGDDPKSGTGAKVGGPVLGNARGAKPTGAAEIVAVPTMKGRLGRIVVKFPEGVEVGCPIRILDGDKAVDTSYGSMSKDVMPGDYTLSIQDRRLEKFEVRSGHESRVYVGVLRLQGAEGTKFELYEPGEKKPFFTCYKGEDVGLAPGVVEVEVAGQRAKVEVLAGQIVDF